jgi:hemerythrin
VARQGGGMIVTLKWTQNLSVRDETIDNQHKHLFAIINRLIQVRKQGAVWQQVLEVINELVAYSTFHFESEDEFMLKSDYPLFISHRKYHMAYMKKVDEFISDFEKQKQELPESMLRFLRDWWINHVSIEDQQIARHIRNGF